MNLGGGSRGGVAAGKAGGDEVDVNVCNQFIRASMSNCTMANARLSAVAD